MLKCQLKQVCHKRSKKVSEYNKVESKLKRVEGIHYFSVVLVRH